MQAQAPAAVLPLQLPAIVLIKTHRAPGDLSAVAEPILGVVLELAADHHRGAVAVERADKLVVGGHDDLGQAIAVQVAGGDTIAVDAVHIAFGQGAANLCLGPAGLQIAVTAKDIEADGVGHAQANDDLLLAVAIQIVRRQGPGRTPVRIGALGPAGEEIALAVQHCHGAVGVGRRDLQLAVPVQILHHGGAQHLPRRVRAAVGIAGVRGGAVLARVHLPLHLSGGGVRHCERIGSGDHFQLAVAVQIRHDGGGPVGLLNVFRTIMGLEHRLSAHQGVLLLQPDHRLRRGSCGDSQGTENRQGQQKGHRFFHLTHTFPNLFPSQCPPRRTRAGIIFAASLEKNEISPKTRQYPR